MKVASRVVITGPTGWVGTAFLSAYSAAWGPSWRERVTLFGSSGRRLIAPDGLELEVRPLSSINGADVIEADVIHLAFLTKEHVDLVGASNFFAANNAIDDAVLGALGAGRPRAIFVASSGAAQFSPLGPRPELYGLCKLMQEERFLAFGLRSGTPTIAGRIFNLAGPFINKFQSYAVSAFLQQALITKSVQIDARTPVYRSYLHVEDLTALVMGALHEMIGVSSPIDLCGAQVVEMEDVAREALRAADAAEGPISRDAVDYERPSLYLGDPTAARTLALRLSIRLHSFAEQVDDTAAFLRTRLPLAG